MSMKRMIACLALALPALVLADEQDALQAYKSGLEAEQRADVHGAIEWYKKALKHRDHDGKIRLPGQVSYEWVETPRGMQRRKIEGVGPSEDYKPKARLDALQKAIAARANDQNRKTKFANPPKLEVFVQLVDAGNDRALDGGENAKLILTVKNNGASPADDVSLDIAANNNAISLDERSLTIGSIEPGKSLIRSVDLTVSRNVSDGDVKFAVTGRERDGFSPAPMNVTAVARAYLPPKLVVSRPMVARSPASPTLLMVSYEVVNAGRGQARDVRTRLQFDDRIILQDESFADKLIGTLKPNESRRLEFGIYTSIPAGENLPIQLAVSESVPENNLSQALALAVPGGGAILAGGGIVVEPQAALAQAVDNVGINIPQGANKEPYSVGVVIGNAAYEQLDPVKFALSDATVVRDYLVKTMGFDPMGVKLEQNAKGRDFRRIFGTRARGFKDGELHRRVSLNSQRRDNPPVFVYYSGHGAPSMGDDIRAYMVPVDTSLRDLELDGYPLDDFYASIAALPSTNVTVVIDSCFSGSSNNGLLQKDISPAMLKTASSITPTQAGNASIFTSTAPSQVSYWFEEGQHSLFTYYFLKGLRGDADENRDSTLTADELHKYLSWQVENYVLNTSRPSNQTPQLVGETERVLVSYGN